jgi:predicted RNA-binding Zn-ribbon protein involved in translation (DUF1610 family)
MLIGTVVMTAIVFVLTALIVGVIGTLIIENKGGSLEEYRNQLPLVGAIVTFGFIASLIAFICGITYTVRYFRNSRMAESKLCLECGYDMRGSLGGTHIQCPECGSEYSVRELRSPQDE